jgi:alpha-D-ribose 1-methylphosphonate 5-triphosphate diphosphatase PhnM
MKVRSIELDEQDLPERITVTMTIQEAVLIGSHVGSVTPTTEATHGVYDALSSVFNAFWEDGINDAKRAVR